MERICKCIVDCLGFCQQRRDEESEVEEIPLISSSLHDVFPNVLRSLPRAPRRRKMLRPKQKDISYKYSNLAFGSPRKPENLMTSSSDSVKVMCSPPRQRRRKRKPVLERTESSPLIRLSDSSSISSSGDFHPVRKTGSGRRGRPRRRKSPWDLHPSRFSLYKSLIEQGKEPIIVKYGIYGQGDSRESSSSEGLVVTPPGIRVASSSSYTISSSCPSTVVRVTKGQGDTSAENQADTSAENEGGASAEGPGGAPAENQDGASAEGQGDTPAEDQAGALAEGQEGAPSGYGGDATELE